ncbi:beta-galactosidase, partial [Bacillus sp. S34]|nr:beta-galactosidase [Bacillus sp. S34]
PDLWADRIRKAKLMGLNTIETYVAWNAHAPSPASFSFEDGLDLGRFLDLVAEEGMHAIVRPGPYICAEWT